MKFLWFSFIWKCFHFFFILEKFASIGYGVLDPVFFVFKNLNTLPFDLHIFQWEVRDHSNCCFFYVKCHSFLVAFKIFFLLLAFNYFVLFCLLWYCFELNELPEPIMYGCHKTREIFSRYSFKHFICYILFLPTLLD